MVIEEWMTVGKTVGNKAVSVLDARQQARRKEQAANGDGRPRDVAGAVRVRDSRLVLLTAADQLIEVTELRSQRVKCLIR